MSPAQTPRQLLIWSIPTIAVFLTTFFWYRKRKSRNTIDIEPIEKPATTELIEESQNTAIQNITTKTTENKPITYSRSLSGVDSAPIDIVSSRSAPLIISDTELDLEIEKIKSMRQKSGSQMSTPIKKKSPELSSPQLSSPQLSLPQLSSPQKVVDEMHRSDHSIDRDSANHSPLDVIMPGSPSLSSVSDNQSDSDSGKGGSDVVTPPLVLPPVQEQSAPSTSSDEELTIYEFVIPQQFVGRLIGRHGAFVHEIRHKTNARLLVKRHPDANSDLKVGQIEGLQSEIDAALKIIRTKFPAKRYPDLSLDRVSFVPVMPACMRLRLIEGVNNDTMVSCAVTPAHLFLQQPTHPTFPNLNVLVDYMNACYVDGSENPSPLLPAPIQPGTICVAESDGSWFRSSIISSDEDEKTSYVEFLDFGGYATVPHTSLRQIRYDFLLLPFQASECFLADVEPLEEGKEWSQEAYDVLMELTTGAVVYTQVIDYVDEQNTIPLVNIYVRVGGRRLVFLNRELGERGVARWTGR